MSTFKNIQGKNIRSYANNAPNPKAGEMWYNRSELKLKGVTAIDAFSSSAPLLTGRASAAGAGTQTAALYNGGSPDTNKCENYNGTGWTSIANLNNALQYAGGCGTETSALIYGDYPEANTTEEFNGSSWSAQEGFSTARRSGASFGLETAAVLAGGTTGPAVSTATEEYNGEAWTGGGSLSQARQYFAGTGIETAGLVFGGSSNPNTTIYANTEEYDGSSWTNGGAMPASRSMMFSWGTQTAGALSGGALPSTTATCLKYDGTSWASSPASMGTATKQGYTSGVGTAQSAGLCAGGDPAISRTEEFNTSSNVVTAAAWASGGTLNTARQRTGGFGAAQTSAVTAAGATAPPASALNKTEEYNGTSWTEGNNVNTGRYNMTAFGTEPAGVLAGVGTPSVSYGGTTEEYNGTSWTTVNPYAAPGANYRSSNGTLTAGLLAGGVAPSPAELSNAVEEYDGTNWSTGNTLPQYQAFNNQAGSQTAAINGGGNAGPAAPGPVSANAISLEYDGTNWTAGPNGNLYSDRTSSFNGGSGTQTAAMFVGGDGVGTSTYNGTTFATAPTVAAARGDTSAAGQAPAATATIFAGSPVPSVGGTTLEFSEETTAANIVDITTN